MGIDAIKFVGSTKKFEEKIESKLHHLCKFMILESKKNVMQRGSLFLQHQNNKMPPNF